MPTNADPNLIEDLDGVEQDCIVGGTVSKSEFSSQWGYSQSALIATLEMQQLTANYSQTAPGSPLSFVLTGNEMNPNGGLLSRFPGLTLPILGVDFPPATPSY